MPRKRKEETVVEPGRGLNLDPELIKQLVPGTLDRATINEQLAALKKAIFERALGAELTHHLGYEKGEVKPGDSENHRNGSSRKRIATDDDMLELSNTVFPETTVQTCIVHLIRNSLDFVSWKDRKQVAAELKQVYRAPSAEAAALALDAFDAGPWGCKYPPIAALWRRAGSKSFRSSRLRRTFETSSIRRIPSSRCTCNCARSSRRAATSRATKPRSN